MTYENAKKYETFKTAMESMSVLLGKKQNSN